MNLFIVTSPFQYLCALEAKSYFECKKNILVIIEQDTPLGKEQQNNLLDSNQWDEVIFAPRNKRKKTTSDLIKKLSKKNQPFDFDMMFFSEYNSWRTRAITSNLKAKRYIHLDDGTMTLVDFESINNKKPKSNVSILKNIYLSLKGLRVLKKTLESELFTIFNLETKEIKIHKNSFLTLKKGQKLFNPNAPIAIVGQGGIGDKRKTPEEDYIEKIKTISEKESKEIIYFPHRTERDSVSRKIEAIEGIKYHIPKSPLEVEMINEGIQISKLITTISTAIFTLKSIDSELPIYTIFAEDNLYEVPEELRTELVKLGINNLT